MDIRHRSISEQNFRRLQALAEPLVDTVDTVLERVLDFYDSNSAIAPPDTSVAEKNAEPRLLVSEWLAPSLPIQRKYNPFDPPDLSHTGVNFAEFNSVPIDSPNWNALLDEAVRYARRNLSSVTDIRRLVPINVTPGCKTDKGYHFLQDANISVQGQSAKDAWRWTAELARQLKFEVKVVFYWQNKKGAAHPGEAGLFIIEKGN